MSEVIGLHDQPVQFEDDIEFVADCCRYSENIMTEAQVRKKWKFDDATWARLGENDVLVAAIELEKVRRIRSGQQKREKSQLLVTRAPDVMSNILLDSAASAKHRIDAAKVLDTFAANGPAGVPAADRFIIQINLGSDTLKFDKSIAIDANDVDPNDVDTGVIAAIAAKPTEGGGGEPI